MWIWRHWWFSRSLVESKRWAWVSKYWNIINYYQSPSLWFIIVFINIFLKNVIVLLVTFLVIMLKKKNFSVFKNMSEYYLNSSILNFKHTYNKLILFLTWTFVLYLLYFNYHKYIYNMYIILVLISYCNYLYNWLLGCFSGSVQFYDCNYH